MSYGQNIIKMTCTDGREFPPNTALLKNDTCVFPLDGDAIADWCLYVETMYGNKKCSERNNSKSIQACTGVCNVNWRDAVRYVFDGDSSTYYKARVVCKDGERKDSIDFFFNLVPSKPKIIKAEFSYDYFDFDLFSFFGTKYDVVVQSERVKEVYVYYTEFYPSDYDNLEFQYIYGFPDMERINENTYALSSDLWSWQQKIRFFANNEYGGSQYSDTLFTNDFVKDQELIDKINETLKIENVSENNEPEDVGVYISHDRLFVKSSDVRQVRLCNVSGQLVLSENKSNNIDLSLLSKGIYIITVITNNNKITTKKLHYDKN